jgi:menaquinol-cytochrome c reductase iron-sulfur subunit
MSRRNLYRLATLALGSLMGIVLAVPGIAFIVTPLRRRGRDAEYQTLTRLSELEPGVPRSFAVIEERQDAWVRYPREPVGSVWLLRRDKGTGGGPEVIALQMECPHLGCAINLAADRKSFVCPCHTSAFSLEGAPRNRVPPRPMDRLKVEVTPGSDPEVRVKFQRFRTQSEEQIPLA